MARRSEVVAFDLAWQALIDKGRAAVLFQVAAT
jgi:hypothetical protein